MKKALAVSVLTVILASAVSSLSARKKTLADINIFQEAYPDLKFEYTYNKKADDFILSVTFPHKEEPEEFYWCNGSLLPENEVANKEKYWSLFYDYPKLLKDPSELTEAEKEELKNFTTRESRKNGAGTPPFFFDSLYSADTRANLEKQLIQTTFLGKKTTIHKRIKAPLEKVEEKISALAQEDADLKKFVDSLKSADAYYWRLISGTNRKSFHSYGIALDIIPKRYTGEVFWSWARDHNPDGWILTPLSRRWIPHEKFIKAFEEEGFIWGGKWAIWDNMHFEYHPEILIFNRNYKW